MVTASPQARADARRGTREPWGATEGGAPFHHRGDDLQAVQAELLVNLSQHRLGDVRTLALASTHHRSQDAALRPVAAECAAIENKLGRRVGAAVQGHHGLDNTA